jgi:hypothetical protein
MRWIHLRICQIKYKNEYLYNIKLVKCVPRKMCILHIGLLKLLYYIDTNYVLHNVTQLLIGTTTVYL